MSKPYDAVTKRLIELRPADWVAFLRLPEGDVSLVDADLSTVTSYADRIIRVDTGGGASYLVHNELESGKDTATVPLRLFHYNASALYKTGLPVVSTVFLLHKGANSPKITGAFDVPDIDGNVYFSFRYNVVRVWQLDPDELLAGGLSVLPFAPMQRKLVSASERASRRRAACDPGDAIANRRRSGERRGSGRTLDGDERFDGLAVQWVVQSANASGGTKDARIDNLQRNTE